MFKKLLNIIDNSSKRLLPKHELKRLKNLPRYSPTKTIIFGKKLFTNDGCTLINDFREILQKGVYQFNTTSSTPIIIDCGSNIGISVLYFKRLYPKSNIFSFEPDPILFRLLKKNVLSYEMDRVTIEQMAIWIDNKGVQFHSEGGHSGRIVGNEKGKNVIGVPSVRLKDFLQKFPHVDMLKMDIEGAEGRVLFDCASELNKCEHIFVEYHSQNDEEQQLHNILKLFSQMGYRYHIKNAFSRKKPFIDRKCMVNMDLQLNLFFYKT